jgi:DNA-binding NarL/FixJ family response regulator
MLYLSTEEDPMLKLKLLNMMIGGSKGRKKEAVEDAYAFQIDFKAWKERLTRTEKKVLQLLMEGYRAMKISELLKLSYDTLKKLSKESSRHTKIILYWRVLNR